MGLYFWLFIMCMCLAIVCMVISIFIARYDAKKRNMPVTNFFWFYYVWVFRLPAYIKKAKTISYIGANIENPPSNGNAAYNLRLLRFLWALYFIAFALLLMFAVFAALDLHNLS